MKTPSKNLTNNLNPSKNSTKYLAPQIIDQEPLIY